MTVTSTSPSQPPADTPTIVAFRRGRTCACLTGTLLVAGVAGLLVGAAVLVWSSGAGPIIGIGLSGVALVVAMRLGLRASTRHTELMQQSPQSEDYGWLRAWIDLSPNIASLVTVRVRDGDLDMATLYEAWRLARAEGMVDLATRAGIRPETAESIRQDAHERLGSMGV